MKKILLLSVAFMLFISCSNEINEDQKLSNKSDLEKIVLVKTTNHQLSPFFLSIGISSVECIMTNNSFEYSIKAKKQITLNIDGISRLTSDFKFILKDGRLYEKNNPDVFFTRINDEIMLKWL